MKSKKGKKSGKAGLVLMSGLLVAAIAVNVGCGVMHNTLDSFLGSRPQLTDELKETGRELARQIEEEGIVLLRNDQNTLPLSKEIRNVNVFGWSATQWVIGGSGSGQSVTRDVDLLSALKNYGVEYNSALIEMYENFQAERPYFSEGALHTYAAEFCRLYEPSVSDENYYSQELLEEAENFSDTAIVVIGRVAGESNDCPKVQYKQTTKDGAIQEDASRTYLDLSTEEEELLRYVGEHYENVVVLVNATNQMTLGAIERIPGIDACMLVGGTGEVGAEAIPEVLFGDVSPSGRTTDTYAYDFKTSPVYVNSGEEGIGYYTNADGLYPADGVTTNGNFRDNPLYEGVAYLDYAESIYMGYRWYETADAEGFWDQVSNEYGNGYEGVVQYPFGYGLSYTDFEWELESATEGALAKDGEVTATVTVTNTGSVAGRDVVQLYYSAPYYSGQIEKSSVVLGDFAKTGLLQPGESESVELTIPVSDLASYDCYDANGNGFSGYELDAGEYVFRIMRNAHEEVASFDCQAENIQYPEDPVTGAEVKNRFTGEDAVDGVALDGSDSEAGIVYLTRADFAGTFPGERAANRAMADNIREQNLYTEEMANAWIDESDEPIVTGADNGLSITNRDGSISELGYQLGADYDDPNWELLLDQMSLTELREYALHGYVNTIAVDSIGKKRTQDLDGPAQVGSFSFAGNQGTGFSNPTVLGQTFNKELAYQFGLLCGAQARELNVDGWYAPGLNLHRSAFGGRNFEYYAEDPYLSGVMAARTVQGSMETGTYTFAKHMIGYDQESMRDGLSCWMTEQALREVYLSPFRRLVQEGGSTGIMSSYGRIGAVWAGGSEALLREVLRNEWGFEGTVLTDYADHHQFMNADQSVRAGGDLWMDGWLSNGKFQFETSSNSFQQELRRVAKDITYTYLHAQSVRQEYAANGGDQTYLVEPNESINVWQTSLIVFDVVIVLLEAAYFIGRAKKCRSSDAVSTR